MFKKIIVSYLKLIVTGFRNIRRPIQKIRETNKKGNPNLPVSGYNIKHAK